MCVDDFSPQDITEIIYDERAANAEAGMDPRDNFGQIDRCIFNELQSFHSTRQLAPCIGTILFYCSL